MVRGWLITRSILIWLAWQIVILAVGKAVILFFSSFWGAVLFVVATCFLAFVYARKYREQIGKAFQCLPCGLRYTHFISTGLIIILVAGIAITIASTLLISDNAATPNNRPVLVLDHIPIKVSTNENQTDRLATITFVLTMTNLGNKSAYQINPQVCCGDLLEINSPCSLPPMETNSVNPLQPTEAATFKFAILESFTDPAGAPRLYAVKKWIIHCKVNYSDAPSWGKSYTTDDYWYLYDTSEPNEIYWATKEQQDIALPAFQKSFPQFFPQ